MEGNEGTGIVVRYQNGVVWLVHVEETGFQVLGHLLLVLIRLDLVHLLDLFLLCSTLNLVSLIALSELLNLPLMQLLLRFLALLIINSLLDVLLTESAGLNTALINVSGHVSGILTAYGLAFLVISSFHLLIAFFITLGK
jgi:hypothetical protein